MKSVATQLGEESEVLQLADDLLTSIEVAQMLRVPVPTLYSWRGKGTGPTAYRVGKQTLYRRQDVLAWLERRKVPA
jgi:excisionase family DNA binding protein